MQIIENYIDGKLIKPCSNTYLDNFNPATAEVYSLIPDSDEQDVELAVDAANRAFPGWKLTGSDERFEILMRIVRLIERDIEMLAEAESIDNGKPVSLAKRVDIPRAAANFRFYATAQMHLSNESFETVGQAFNYTLRQPIGVVGCISPWNLPLYLFTWKIAPAIAAGCCVVAKPSEVTPLTAYLLSKLCIEAGLPNGVLNIVHGQGTKTGAAIVKHKEIKAISFTGGTSTGEWIAKETAPMFKKLSLELGGKNPNIIFADCNYDEMLETTLLSSFSNQGEICLCGSRIFVQKPIYEKFKRDFVERTKQLKIGNPKDAETNIGAIVSRQHYDKILSYINLAKTEGGNVLCGGNPVKVSGLDGWFIEPAIIENLPFDCRTNQEEIFGPVVTIQPFETEDEVLKYANSVRYGLASTIWTENLSVAHRLAGKIEAGIVWINCWLLRDLRTPFGGVKDSGIGREGGFEALRFFMEEKNVCVKLK